MEVILEPNVIFSLLVSLVIAMLSKRLARLGEYLIEHISLLPLKTRSQIRIAKWRYRKSLIVNAKNHHKITWAVIRTYALLIIFMLVVVLYLLLIAIGPFKGMGSLPWAVQLFIAVPVYIFEVLWLLQKEKAQVLVKVSDRFVTKP